MKKLKLAAIEQKAAIHILIALLEKDQMNVADFLMEIPYSQKAIYTAKEKLHEANLIEIEELPRSNVKLHKLTEKGRRVAERLLEIEKMLEDWKD